MSVPARKIEMEHKMNERTALDEKVDHIQRDVTELKTDVKRVEAKLDEKVGALNTKLDEKFGAVNAKLDGKVDALNTKVDAKGDAANAKLDAVTKNLAEHRLETEKSFGALRSEMKDASRSLITWMIGIAIAAVGSASALANYFAARSTPPVHETSREDADTTRRINGADTDSAQGAISLRESGGMMMPIPRFTRGTSARKTKWSAR